MTDGLHRSTSSSNDSSQDRTQNSADAVQPTTALDLYQTEALTQQILDSSYDCIKVLNLEGRILFINRGGQALLDIQNMASFLNASWIEFWQGAEQQLATEAIAKASAGEVFTFQGFCPTLSGEPKWWDNKISPIRGIEGQIEQLLCISRDVTKRMRAEDDRNHVENERKQAEERLRENEEHLSAIFSQAAVGLSKLSLDGRFQQVNDELCRLLGRSREQLLMASVRDVTHPEDVSRSLEAFGNLVQTGQPISFDKRYLRGDGTNVWSNSSLTRLNDKQGHPRAVLAVTVDLSKRKQAEEILQRAAELNAFRVSLSDTLRPLADPVEVQATASRLLGEYLGANRVAYFEVRGADYVVEQDYVNGVAALAGGYPIDSFGTKLLAAYRSGQTVDVSNVEADANLSPAQRAAYAAIQIGAYIGIPLIKSGEFVAGLAVHASGLRNWTPDEVTLAEEVAEYTWAAVERARAEAALRASEAKYRMLFNSMDEGYFLADVIFDENDQPIDILYLDANLAATRMVGQNFIGRRLSEIDPNYESHWYEIFGRVARTGGGERLERYAAPNQAWYDFYIFKVGDETSRRVSIIFQDITARRRVEEALRQSEVRQAFLLKLSDVLRNLTDPETIQYQAASMLGEYLGANRVGYAQDQGDGELMVTCNYTNGVPGIEGRYGYDEDSSVLLLAFKAGRTVVQRDIANDPTLNDEEKAAHAALQLGAIANVPLVKAGRVAAVLFVHYGDAHAWSADELALIQEVAERTWDAVERARVEAALRASEERYRTLFDSIDEAFCLVELVFDDNGTVKDYRFLETNPAFEKITALKNATGRTACELVPNLESHWVETLGKVAQTRQPERRVIESEAMGFWCDLYAFPVSRLAAHKVAILFSDVTRRKQAEQHVEFLTELSRKLGTVTDAAEINRIVTREVGTFLNGHRCYYLDVTPEADYVTVLPDWRLNGVDLAGTYNLTLFGIKEWQETAARQPLGIDDVNTHPWTKDFPAHYMYINIRSYVIAPFVREGRWVASIGVSSDQPRHWTVEEMSLLENVAARVAPLIERARAEAAALADLQDTQLLRELGARLVTEGDSQTLYQEIISAAITLTRADAGSIQVLDESTQELVLIAAQGIEQTIIDHFQRVTAKSNIACKSVLETGNRTFMDFDLPQSEDLDGSLLPYLSAGFLSAQSTPLITRSGKRIGMVSTHWYNHHRPSDRELRFLDLLARQAADLIEQRQTATEREQLLAREQAAREEADRANRIKDEFLAVLSHELRSPLNPILGWSKLLQNGNLDAAKTQQALKTIERNAQLQSELIEDLLDVSRILQGQLRLNVAPVNLVSIIQGAMETVRLAAEAKSIHIEASLNPEVGLVSGDSTRLQQVIWNLLSNAVKFTPTEGQVNIQLERFDAYAQITISDTGQGITPDFLPYVFDYFRQANATTTRKFGGLGLGLAIVRHLVELHGGTVGVESPGLALGTTFTVQLPLRSAQIADRQNDQLSEPSFNLDGVQVLVVDDEPDSREFIAFVLEQAGAIVITATTADEALAMLIRSQPDVLLSDIGMPDMDGYMLMQQVRTLSPEQGGKVKAVALTAYAGDFNQQQALQAGFQRHVSKPIEPEMLVRTIANLLKFV